MQWRRPGADGGRRDANPLRRGREKDRSCRRRKRAGGYRSACRRMRKTQAGRLAGESSPVLKTQVRRSGDPAIRRSGDPAIRRSGDPAIIVRGAPSDLVKPCAKQFFARPAVAASAAPSARIACRPSLKMVIAISPNLSPGLPVRTARKSAERRLFRLAYRMPNTQRRQVSRAFVQPAWRWKFPGRQGRCLRRRPWECGPEGPEPSRRDTICPVAPADSEGFPLPRRAWTCP